MVASEVATNGDERTGTSERGRANMTSKHDERTRRANTTYEMSGEKQSVPKFSGPSDNFRFWATRIKAFLAEKDLEQVLEWEDEDVPDTTESV